MHTTMNTQFSPTSQMGASSAFGGKGGAASSHQSPRGRSSSRAVESAARAAEESALQNVDGAAAKLAEEQDDLPFDEQTGLQLYQNNL